MKIAILSSGHGGSTLPLAKAFLNHGYAVDSATLPSEWEELFVNMNDGSNEGIRHKNRPWFSAQFHPEACSGPLDTEFLFDEYLKLFK